MATLTQLVTDIGTVGTFFWGLFSDFITMITSNSLLLWSVLFAIVAGTVGMVLKVVRKFGLKAHK